MFSVLHFVKHQFNKKKVFVPVFCTQPCQVRLVARRQRCLRRYFWNTPVLFAKTRTFRIGCLCRSSTHREFCFLFLKRNTHLKLLCYLLSTSARGQMPLSVHKNKQQTEIGMPITGACWWHCFGTRSARCRVCSWLHSVTVPVDEFIQIIGFQWRNEMLTMMKTVKY